MTQIIPLSKPNRISTLVVDDNLNLATAGYDIIAEDAIFDTLEVDKITADHVGETTAAHGITFDNPANLSQPVAETVVTITAAVSSTDELGGAANYRVGRKVTFAGVRVKKATFNLTRTLLPAQDIICRIRKVSDDSIVAEAVARSAQDVPLAGGNLNFNFPWPRPTLTGDHYICLEVTALDAANYLSPRGEHAGADWYYYTAAWHALGAGDYRLAGGYTVEA